MMGLNRRNFLVCLGATAAVGGCQTVQSGELPPSTGPEQTDEASLKVRFLGSGSACWEKEPRTAAIMEATGQPGRKFGGLNISHSTADDVHRIFTTYLKPGSSGYKPASPEQPVYLTHIGYYEWGQKTFDDILPSGLALAHDGLEVEFRPAK